MVNGNRRLVRRPHLEPGQVGRDRRVQVEQPGLVRLQCDHCAERLAHRADLERRVRGDPVPILWIGRAVRAYVDRPFSVGEGDRHRRVAHLGPPQLDVLVDPLERLLVVQWPLPGLLICTRHHSPAPSLQPL